MDGTLTPTRDRTVAASSNNCRYSTNHQAVIDADTRLLIADGGYRGTGPTIPHYRPHKDEDPPAWKEEHNTSRYKVRARVEYTFARMKSWKILCDCRPKSDGVHHAILGIARLHTLTG